MENMQAKTGFTATVKTAIMVVACEGVEVDDKSNKSGLMMEVETTRAEMGDTSIMEGLTMEMDMMEKDDGSMGRKDVWG